MFGCADPNFVHTTYQIRPIKNGSWILPTGQSQTKTCFFTNENTLKGFATQLLMTNLHQLIWRWLIWVVRAGFPISQQSFCLPSIWLLHCDSLSLKNTCRYLHGLSCVETWFMSRILEMPPEKKKNVILLRYVFGIQGIQQPSHSKCLEMTSSCRVRHEHYLAAKAVGCTSKCSPWKEPAAACMGVYSIKYYDMICVCMYICI